MFFLYIQTEINPIFNERTTLLDTTPGLLLNWTDSQIQYWDENKFPLENQSATTSQKTCTTPVVQRAKQPLHNNAFKYS